MAAARAEALAATARADEATLRMVRAEAMAEAVAEVVGRELRSRGLAVPHGFKPSAVKQEECDDLSGKPPT